MNEGRLLTGDTMKQVGTALADALSLKTGQVRERRDWPQYPTSQAQPPPNANPIPSVSCLQLLEKNALWPPYSNTTNQIAACRLAVRASSRRLHHHHARLYHRRLRRRRRRLHPHAHTHTHARVAAKFLSAANILLPTASLQLPRVRVQPAVFLSLLAMPSFSIVIQPIAHKGKEGGRRGKEGGRGRRVKERG